MAAIDEKGFLRPTYAALLEKQEQRAKELLGSDVDTGELSVLGKFIRIQVYDLAKLYEELEEVYYARFPGYAKGVNLDRLTPFAGVHRNPAVAAAYRVCFVGLAGAQVPAGLRLAAAGGAMFCTEAALQLDETGQAEATAVCTEAGPAGNVAASSITVFVNPIAQVSGFTVLNQCTFGQPRESDAELRKRFVLAVSGIGSATAEAIKASILRVAGVQGCVMSENDGGELSPEGLPPHSFEAFVLGAAAKDGEIARAIFDKKPLGIYSHGKVQATVLDSAGNPHTVRFSRVVEVPLKLRISLKVDKLFPQNGKAKIQSAVAGFVNALPNGQSLVYSQLYPVLYALPGVCEVSSLLLSTDGGESYSAQNIPASPEKAVRCQNEDIELEVVADAN